MGDMMSGLKLPSVDISGITFTVWPANTTTLELFTRQNI